MATLPDLVECVSTKRAIEEKNELGRRRDHTPALFRVHTGIIKAVPMSFVTSHAAMELSVPATMRASEPSRSTSAVPECTVALQLYLCLKYQAFFNLQNLTNVIVFPQPVRVLSVNP